VSRRPVSNAALRGPACAELEQRERESIPLSLLGRIPGLSSPVPPSTPLGTTTWRYCPWLPGTKGIMRPSGGLQRCPVPG
jgi:hypothetical protein